MRAAFLDALARLHERFLVDVEGVTEVWLVRHGDAYGELTSGDDPAAPQGDEGFLSGGNGTELRSKGGRFVGGAWPGVGKAAGAAA